jgi:hypothetical protein
MIEEKYWLIRETEADDDYYYSGYYETGKPVFCVAIADAVAIASFSSARTIFDVLNKIVSCEILLVSSQGFIKYFQTNKSNYGLQRHPSQKIQRKAGSPKAEYHVVPLFPIRLGSKFSSPVGIFIDPPNYLSSEIILNNRGKAYSHASDSLNLVSPVFMESEPLI